MSALAAIPYADDLPDSSPLMPSTLDALISKLHRFNPALNAEELADALWYTALYASPRKHLPLHSIKRRNRLPNRPLM
ncbi:MAG: hypothetical protein GY862_21580, partial [Gammaproteobacteria bacterium]|nr:hypothetical protein [Gammaproteobacteria bacterium]